MEWDPPVVLDEYSLRLRVSAASDVGSVRAINEDGFLASSPVFLVADGMGGHAQGDRASSEVVRVFSERHAGESSTTSAALLETIATANRAVRALTDAVATDLAIAGTTLTGIALLDGAPPSWMAFNVGDSRVYGWQAGRLEQITVDHSAVQELVDDGVITRDEADVHPERNVVTRAMGVDDDAEADVWLLPAGGRQLFLICSDGLTKEVTDAEIAGIIRDFEAEPDGGPLAPRLVAAAIAAGGKDNVTVVVVEAERTATAVDAGSSEPSRLPAFLEETVPRT
jgi:serine/threonine protein phosphatase PrpC